MPSLIISNLDEVTTARLEERAARNGSTPEEMARALLDKALGETDEAPRTLGDLRTRFLEVTDGGVNLDPYLPKRQEARETVDFDT